MTQDDVERIVAGLSAAMKDALLGKFSWPGLIEQDEGERELDRLGLWGPHGGNSETAKAVRALLERQAHD